ncbi:MAG: DEAD/DEAH box helicase [Siphonobacter aquaeclarae]|jgi:ATP-dependent RNA helicase DeaD|nr:DEAD/DEAH box helicase [Siphonobacter aquaeclarae]
MENQILFADLGLSDEVMQAVTEMGFVAPSPIQAESIPFLLDGRDVIGQAQTGTGKTAAFGIPLIDKIDPNDKYVQSLILCPTRELAVQVSEELRRLAKFKRGVWITAIYGGDSYERQNRDLRKGCQIVVGTPGRVMDHIERGTLRLDQLKYIVLDEADEMLDMGFREDIESVLADCPEDRQTVFFSATMPKPILDLTKRYQRNPQLVKVTKNEVTNANIDQSWYAVRPDAKFEAMCRLIDFHQIKLMLVFSNQKARVDEIVEQFQMRGYAAEGLHGDMRQAARNQVMSKFRGGTTQILVATDVAARGIDVDDVEAVFNYDVPMDSEYYVHRIGRTGRAGKSGKAFTLASGSEKYRIRDIQNYTKVEIPRGKLPTFADVFAIKKTRFVERVQQTIEEGTSEFYSDIFDTLQEAGYEASAIVSALAQLNLGGVKMTEDNLEEEARKKFDRAPGDRNGNSRFGDRRGNDRFGDRRNNYNDGRGGNSTRERVDRDGKPFRRGTDAGMVRLFINIGKNFKITPSHIVGAITGETGLPGKVIGQIDLFDSYSFVDVPKEHQQTILNALDGNTIKGKRVNVEVARV